MKKILKKTAFVILGFLVLFFAYLFIGSAKPAEDIVWGVNFSQKHAKNLGIDWKEAYLAILDDLKVRDLKLVVYWDLLEKENNQYDFNDLDWQINEAEKRGAKLFLVIGMKTLRWPECHIPEWAKGLGKKEQRDKTLGLIEAVVQRYKGRVSVWAWQVENEPFFSFGECPEGVIDKSFLKKEIELVRSIDSQKPVIITDSGEFSFWIAAAKSGDIVGITMYEKAWFRDIKKYYTYPFPPVFYYRKAEIIRKLFGKDVIGVELQAEPWCPTSLLADCPVQEQEKTMDLRQFKRNIEFAKGTGFNRHYFWGTEWWYWMKEKQNKPEIWEEAKKLFQ